MGMMIGSRLLSIIAGPVNVWNTTWKTPPIAEITGYYSLSGVRIADRTPLPHHSGFRLAADHRAEVTNLPAFDGFGHISNCSYNGTGKWHLWDGGEVRLEIDLQESTASANSSSCAPVSLNLFHLLGHSPPYRIWYNVGDPDEEQGLTYVQQGR
jgi:hypothetical protein